MSLTGLSSPQAEILLKKYGENILIPKPQFSQLTKLRKIIFQPIFLLLFAVASIYFLLGEATDGCIMLFFVMFMLSINLIQEYKTEKTLQSLQDLTTPNCKVYRDQHWQTLPATLLVPGDLISLIEGDKVPADGKLVEITDLAVNESTLTGEADLVWKSHEDKSENFWRLDYCYAGTAIIQGSAKLLLTATGGKTHLGQINQSLQNAPTIQTPLEIQIGRLVKTCTLLSFCLLSLVSLLTYLSSQDIIAAILAGLTLAMATLPEEFPVILTVFLAMGAWRLAKQNALIRNIVSTQTLGCVSVLCFDKTGTITHNEMTCQELYPTPNFNPQQLLEIAVYASEIGAYDKMEQAILSCAQGQQLNIQQLQQTPLVTEYPFTSETKMMGHAFALPQTILLAAKGACESILPLCKLTPPQLAWFEELQKTAATKAYRLIAVAQQTYPTAATLPADLTASSLELVGILAFNDPPRAAASTAIAHCQQAGIKTIMITGDNHLTAQSIAQQIGMTGDYLTGEQLNTLSQTELQAALTTTRIFARTIPQQKLRIIQALQANGEVVAMTGDGVNDAPALKYADIGISMGKNGTEVARQAADLVLLDDNILTIVDSIKDARRTYDNIRKAINYVLIIHLPIILFALLIPSFNLPVLLLPIHIVLLEMLIDPTCSIIFEQQPAELTVMNRPPHKISDDILLRTHVLTSCLQGVVIFLTLFFSYCYLLKNSVPLSQARTFCLTSLLTASLMLVFVNQAFTRSFSKNFSVNKANLIISLIVALTILALNYNSLCNLIFKTAPLSLLQLSSAIALGIGSTIWYDFTKKLA